jgi:hypothetical protein
LVDTGKIGRAIIDTIPFSPHLLNSTILKQCVVCDEVKGQLQVPETRRWAAVKRLCPGNWSWQIANFPTSSDLPKCEHDFDICYDCIRSFIEAQVNSRGTTVVGNITCPSVDCNHKLTRAEIRRLASQQIFDTYDYLAMRAALSAAPDSH